MGNKEKLFWGSLFGVAFMGLQAVGALIFLPDNVWPTPMQWIKFGFVLFGQYCAGIFLFMKDPNKAWLSVPKE